MKITKSQIAIIAIVVLSFAISFYYYPQLPEKMASHWNGRGEVDGYMNKTAGAFIMPVVMTGMVLMFFVILRIDPLKKNIEKFKSYYYGFIIAMCLFLFGVHWWMMLWNVGVKVSVNRVMPGAIGALFFFMGHIMKNIKRNWFMGIKTPWTLSNDIVWKRTHDVSGRLFMACGVIAMCGMFFPKYSIWLILVPMLATVVFSIVYSYIVYRKVTKAKLDGTAEMKIESSGDATWDNIKEGYLYQVERSLLKVKHTAKKEILEDISSHLDQKYAELNEDDKVWESYQQIITEMGPAQDYAELLNGDTPQLIQKPKKWLMNLFIINIFISIVVVLGVLCWLGILKYNNTAFSVYIVSFEGEGSFNPETAKELLDAFDNRHADNAKTSYFRTEIKDNKLIGHICVNIKQDKESLINRLEENIKLDLVKVRAVTRQEFEKHKALGQPGLWVARPRVVKTLPATFSNKVSADLAEISVTFDRDMMDLSWSWVGGGEIFPQTAGEPKYDEERKTCSLPLILEPGKVYRIGINSKRFTNFQTEMGVAAEPYVILFATADENGSPTEIPASYIKDAQRINKTGPELKSIDVTIDAFRIVWQGLPKGRFKMQTNILNRGRDRCEEFDFVIRGVDYFENLVYTAGPIESGEIWRAETSDFKLADGVYEFTVELDPANSIEELKEDNNRKTNKFKLKYGKPYTIYENSIAAGQGTKEAVSRVSGTESIYQETGRKYNPTLDKIIELFGEPIELSIGGRTYTRKNLPGIYRAKYPNGFDVYVHNDKIRGLRFREPGFVYQRKIQVGSTLEEALAVIGQPKETLVGQPNMAKDGVFYKNANGQEGRDFYRRDDKNIVFRFFNNEVVMIDIMSSGKSEIPDIYIKEAQRINNKTIGKKNDKHLQSAYTWLELIDNGQYGKSWEEAASIFKSQVSRSQWEKAIENIYRPLGKVIDRELISQRPTKTVPGGPDGDYVIIQFRTDFENKKGAIETVTPMLEKDGQWRVSGYFIK